MKPSEKDNNYSHLCTYCVTQKSINFFSSFCTYIFFQLSNRPGGVLYLPFKRVKHTALQDTQYISSTSTQILRSCDINTHSLIMKII